jgi:quercetin dioxygenase-like cupin family protein
MMRRTQMLLLVAVVTASVGAGVAWATGGGGITGGATILARGTLSPHFKLKLHDSSEPADVVMQHLTFAPNGAGFSGWHTHPGPAIVVVQSGQITFYESDDPSCTGTTYTAGQVYVDGGYGHVHYARNEGATPTDVWVTFFDVPPGTSPRIDAPSPGNCPF